MTNDAAYHCKFSVFPGHPNTFSGSEKDHALLLSELYGSLTRRIEIFISLPFASLDRMALKARLDELGGGSMNATRQA